MIKVTFLFDVWLNLFYGEVATDSRLYMGQVVGLKMDPS